ncbi:MAG TPA: helix-turn-helix domain-containing protein [Actinophytocola sp.]|nr:helix-turn-helix domain-containing protein [Actinophytocola sp.]
MSVARAVDPLWEMVFSRVRLDERDRRVEFEPWVRRLRRGDDTAAVRSGRRILRALSPVGPYFPDFLTPPEGAHGLRPGVAAVRATPRARLRRELGLLGRRSGLPTWASRLAAGDRALLTELGDALTAYHRAAIDPFTGVIEAAVEADRARRARAALDGGVDGLLHSLRPMMRWQPPVLHVSYRVDRDLHLGGRGLRLVPSFFSRRTPVAYADPSLVPVVTYPIDHHGSWRHRDDRDRALAPVLGTTRAAVLAAVGTGATTTELSARLGTSPSSMSRHTRALREAGIITSDRDGPSVRHTVTALGDALLHG